MAVLLRPAAIAGGRQVWPVAEEQADAAAAASQRLVEAVARGDSREAGELLASGRADVNYAGVVWLDARRVAEAALREGAAAELRASREEIRADVSPLFLAAGNGDVALVRALLAKGADVNGKVFRGYPATAAAREGRAEVAELLVRAGASQPACEEAIVEAALQGQAALAAIFMRSDLVRPRVAVHALVSAATRGFVDVVDTLVKCGADPNATSRVLLRSLKPSLHLNVDCTALFAAIVSRQVAVVRQLLQAGVKRDTKVRLGAWSWDAATGEELRVGAGLAEPYDAAWCAVEYYESTGSILRMLLQNGYSSGATHLGRTLLHHAILCGSVGAVETLLASGAECEAPVRTSRSGRFRPVHLAARLGQPEILQTLTDKGCDVNARAEAGDVAIILAARHKQEDCLRVLVSAGADVALLNLAGESAASVASSGGWKAGFERAVLGAIRSGTIPLSSDRHVFSPMMFTARCGDAAALEVLLAQPGVDVDEQDADGCSPIMAAAKEGNVDAFRALVFAGANVRLCNKRGETAIGLAQQSKKRDLFEQVMLEFALEKGMPAGGFYALHCASRRGDSAAVHHLASTGYDVNMPDGDGYTPLMLAAREGHATVCELLISHGARCDIQTPRGETALSLARSALATAAFNKAEDVIMDELGRQLVLAGARVVKHTKGGRGRPHGKSLRMVAAAGVLRWGGSSRRNVMCVEAEVGGSSAFQRHRQRKGRRGDDAYAPGLFRVVTATGKEVHFVCQGGEEAAELWVRGIRALTRAVFGKRGN
ncbi:ankyrin-3 [Triticum urartu]|uniref:Ankyrin-3 n=1 Tax=Triticum urartu TaxID=4572 RepID=A0A8R7PGQ5_TRIUA|nr:ankyrin-3-like [Triticum dicoccoides]XP_048558065.1 ankyrin-3 [Triticum urartu]